MSNFRKYTLGLILTLTEVKSQDPVRVNGKKGAIRLHKAKRLRDAQRYPAAKFITPG